MEPDPLSNTMAVPKVDISYGLGVFNERDSIQIALKFNFKTNWNLHSFPTIPQWLFANKINISKTKQLQANSICRLKMESFHVSHVHMSLFHCFF